MKNIAAHFFLVSLYVWVPDSAPGQFPQVGQDTIFLRQGDRLVGKLMGIDERSIRLRRLLPPLSGVSADAAPIFASIMVLRSDVDRVEFSSDEAQERMLKNATAANLSDIEALWREKRVWLGVPKSSAGAVGLVYGDLLLRNGDLASARKALDLFRAIETGTWSHHLAMRARQGRLRAMVAAGIVQEAVVEAKEIERVAEDPAVLIEAKFILAKAAEKALRKLVEDNPRWEEDAFVLPERNRLYEEAVELYLYPALFFGSEIEVASRGLWSAVEVYRFAGDLKQALEASLDLVEIYPGTSYARWAQDLIDTLPESLRKKYNENEEKQ
jgi:tetratricopeptide (TPR) repeat protein